MIEMQLNVSHISVLLIFCTLLLLAVLCAVVYLGFMLKRRTSRIEEKFKFLHNHVWDTLLLSSLMPPGPYLPHPSGWAASTDLLVEAVRRIQSKSPDIVVELGSGLSTVVIASALMKNGKGKLISIEHDKAYAEKSYNRIVSAGLVEYVDIRVCPLVGQEMAGKSKWYDTAYLDEIDNVDLLIVDGPPALFDERIRFPALPFFSVRMATGGVMIFDDTNRDGEKGFINDWLKKNGNIDVEWLPLEKGAAVLSGFVRPDES